MATRVIITVAGQHLIEHLARKYNLTIDAYESLEEEQDGRCAVCRTLPKPGRRLHVDHDHHTMQVRGLLCGSCNAALGLMDENEQLIDALASYARKAAALREIVRQQPRSVLGVARRTKHPLTRAFERVLDKTPLAQGIFETVQRWRRETPQRSLPLPAGVEEFWPTTAEENAATVRR